MKARIENNKIEYYPVLPQTYKSETLGLILGFDKLSDEIHQKEGFYDVVYPTYNQYTQRYSELYFDEINKVFTYNLITLDEPIIPQALQKRVSKLEFINLFTDTEFKNIIQTSKTNIDIELWLMKFNLAEYIDLYDAVTIQGVNVLETIGLIATGRAAQILA